VRTTTTKSHTPVRWLTTDVVMNIDSRGTTDIAMPDVVATVQRATENWNTKIVNCSFIRLNVEPPFEIQDVSRDRRPVVVFRDKEWRRPGLDPYDPQTLAVTTLFYVSTPDKPGDGTVIDADIEINAVDHTITLDPSMGKPRPGTTFADLENTLTHELGHVLGLAHTCNTGASSDSQVDNLGRPVPNCGDPNVTQEMIEATMYPTASADDISKRSVELDDAQGICDTYPNTEHYPLYTQIDGGCAVTAHARTPTLAVIAVIAIAVFTRRRRRS
jgi:hypothetical protein